MNNQEISQLKEKTSHGSLMLPMNVYYISEDNGSLDLYLHWHEEMELIYIENGSCTFYIDLQAYQVSKGDLVIIKPDTLHSAVNEAGQPFKSKSIVFSLNMLKSFILDSSLLNFIDPLINNEFAVPVILHADSAGYWSLVTSLDSIMEVYKDRCYGFELEIKSLLFHILAILFKENHIKKLNIKKDIKNKDIDKVKAVLYYIHSNFNKDIPINVLAYMIGFSTFHFIRFFKKNTGQTCTQYINAFRLEKAARLLIDSKLSITDISLETGFNNTSYFIKLFKIRYGFSPSAFRRSFTTYAQHS